jgi:hypothetical protein
MNQTVGSASRDQYRFLYDCHHPPCPFIFHRTPPDTSLAPALIFLSALRNSSTFTDQALEPLGASPHGSGKMVRYESQILRYPMAGKSKISGILDGTVRSDPSNWRAAPFRRMRESRAVGQHTASAKSSVAFKQAGRGAGRGSPSRLLVPAANEAVGTGPLCVSQVTQKRPGLVQGRYSISSYVGLM